ncbi:MAG: hypothetical protein PHR36_00180 [Patescibacteria group bacterium]|nr:hypothetical protein [Patescibacteria group bacterium]
MNPVRNLARNKRVKNISQRLHARGRQGSTSPASPTPPWREGRTGENIKK